MKKFNRNYHIQVGEKAGSGVVLRPPIKIDLTSGEDSELVVWGLSADTIKGLRRPDIVIVAKAGYEELSLVGRGDVTDVRGDREKVTISFRSGYTALRDTAVSLSYPPGTQASEVVQDIADQMGIPLRIGPEYRPRGYPHGYSFYGAAWEALDQLCNKWHIDNGVLNVAGVQGFMGGRAIHVHPIIGIPEPLDKAAERLKGESDTPGNQARGYKVVTLLDPTIRKGAKVSLGERGEFVCTEVTHVAQYPEGDWLTTIECEL